MNQQAPPTDSTTDQRSGVCFRQFSAGKPADLMTDRQVWSLISADFQYGKSNIADANRQIGNLHRKQRGIAMIDIPSRFRKLRTDKGFSVYRLSKESDVSENYIHKIERGENQPSVYILEKLLSCLGTTLPEFLNEDAEVMYPSDFERELLENIRVLPEEKAQALLKMAKLLKS